MELGGSQVGSGAVLFHSCPWDGRLSKRSRADALARGRCKDASKRLNLAKKAGRAKRSGDRAGEKGGTQRKVLQKLKQPPGIAEVRLDDAAPVCSECNGDTTVRCGGLCDVFSRECGCDADSTASSECSSSENSPHGLDCECESCMELCWRSDSSWRFESSCCSYQESYYHCGGTPTDSRKSSLYSEYGLYSEWDEYDLEDDWEYLEQEMEEGGEARKLLQIDALREEHGLTILCMSMAGELLAQFTEVHPDSPAWPSLADLVEQRLPGYWWRVALPFAVDCPDDELLGLTLSALFDLPAGRAGASHRGGAARHVDDASIADSSEPCDGSGQHLPTFQISERTSHGFPEPQLCRTCRSACQGFLPRIVEDRWASRVSFLCGECRGC